MPYFSCIQKLLDKIALIARENLKGVRVIRAFSNQNHEVKRFNLETKNQKDEQVKVGKIQALLNPFTYLIVNFAIIIIIYASGCQVNVGSLSQGEVIALINYMNSILQALIVFANVLSIYNKATASYQRVFEVLETTPQVENQGSYSTLIPDEKMIEFKDVNFGYLQKDVLHNLSFTINKGETVGIIGGTGAGKSTLVSLIGRNYDVRSGQIKIAGKNIQDYKLETLRQHISYVLQNTSLISGTIKENICMSKPYQEETMNKALEVSQAKEFVSCLPQGIESAVVQGGKNFSGGQRQRLTIARALYKQADILVLDDCSSALDYATDAALQKQLQELKESDKHIFVRLEKVDSLNEVISVKESQDIISMMYLMPNGFMHKSLKMDLTNISLNMGVVEMNEKFNIYFSIRSPMESAKDELSNKLSLIASMFKAKYVLDNNYPGWNYDEGSKLRKQYVDFVKETEGITLKEEGTHSGLETGIFKGALQDLDIITLGPDMFDIHTPDERLNMNSFYKCYQRLIHFLERL